MSNYPSIFNDVIGPVMRGPSSSHCAASIRIARICRDLMDEQIKDIVIEDVHIEKPTVIEGRGATAMTRKKYERLREPEYYIERRKKFEAERKAENIKNMVLFSKSRNNLVEFK